MSEIGVMSNNEALYKIRQIMLWMRNQQSHNIHAREVYKWFNEHSKRLLKAVPHVVLNLLLRDVSEIEYEMKKEGKVMRERSLKLKEPIPPIAYTVNIEEGTVKAQGVSSCGIARLKEGDVFNEEFGKKLSKKIMVSNKKVKTIKRLEREIKDAKADRERLDNFIKKAESRLTHERTTLKTINSEITEMGKA